MEGIIGCFAAGGNRATAPHIGQSSITHPLLAQQPAPPSWYNQGMKPLPLSTLLVLLALAACAGEYATQPASELVSAATNTPVATLEATRATATPSPQPATATPQSATPPAMATAPGVEPTAVITVAPPTSTRRATASPVPTSSVVPGWLTYENESLGYSFSYPPEARLGTVGIMGFPPEELPENMTADEYLAHLQSLYPDGLCVGLTYQAVHITFVPTSERVRRYVDCGITGTGDARRFEDEEQSLIIDGRQVTGITTRLYGQEGNWRGEFTMLDINDELEIHYGEVNNSTHEAFLAAQETLMQIVMSLRLD